MTDFERTKLASPSGATLQLYGLETSGNPKAVIHINHGMCEHIGRYEHFCKFLAENGYHSVGHDHRGHGKTTAPDAPIGTFAKKNGWSKVIEDVLAVNTEIARLYPETPIIYFGHSMGAIVGLSYCIKHSNTIAGAALWNSGVDGGPLLTIYGLLLKVERMLKGSDVPSQIARKLAFEDWNKKFAPNRTQSDWLTRDETEVDKYLADPLCGFDASNGLWTDLLGGIRLGASDHEISKIDKQLPIHLLAGGQDPCSDRGKGVKRLDRSHERKRDRRC